MQDIHIGDEGKGFPLVLIHGFLSGPSMWIFQEKIFKHSHRLIMPSLAGYGESSNLKAPTTIRENAEQIFDLLNYLEIKNSSLTKYHRLDDQKVLMKD